MQDQVNATSTKQDELVASLQIKVSANEIRVLGLVGKHVEDSYALALNTKGRI